MSVRENTGDEVRANRTWKEYSQYKRMDLRRGQTCVAMYAIEGKVTLVIP